MARVISNFMSRRADQITASDPDLVKRLNGNGDNGDDGPVAFTSNGTVTNNLMAFAESRSVANLIKLFIAEGLAGRRAGKGASARPRGRRK